MAGGAECCDTVGAGVVLPLIGWTEVDPSRTTHARQRSIVVQVGLLIPVPLELDVGGVGDDLQCSSTFQVWRVEEGGAFRG